MSPTNANLFWKRLFCREYVTIKMLLFLYYFLDIVSHYCVLGGEVKGGRCYHSIFSRRRDAEIQFDIFLKKHFTTKFTDVNTAERQMESESDTVEK